MKQVKYIEVNAGVRYWEDAEGKIPLRKGDDWCQIIELATGRVPEWPGKKTP